MNLLFSTQVFFMTVIGSFSLVTASTLATPTSPPPVPDSLKVPEGQTLLLKSMAQGSQIYACQPKQGADVAKQYEWVLKAPNAKLFDERNQLQGKHYKGPTWEWNDGSKIVGQVKAKADAPDPNAIPWLLLEAQAETSAKVGTLKKVKWIQRVNTTGGKAPRSGCDRTTESREVRIQYSADYYFYGDRP
jgi:hypothetical protein